MLVPLLLIVPAVLAAGVVAYGTMPQWAQYSDGLEFIMLTRRLQWPLLVLAILLCLALLVLVIAGRRRAWWLIGLAPVLALVAHRFTTGPARAYAILNQPAFVAPDAATFLKDDDHVVGLVFGDNAYAYPFATLWRNPVVVQADQNKRMILMWSAYANRAMAFSIDRSLRARELEIVSTPANALLLYNTRLGQFINALTARTKTGQRPNGFNQRIATSKLPWRQWRELYPNTRVMAVTMDESKTPAPTAPVLPLFPLPRKLDLGGADADARIALVGADSPIAIPSQQITAAPLNVSMGQQLLLVFRDPAHDVIRAFDRHIWDELTPRFVLNHDPKRANVYLIDRDTNSGWTSAGISVDGDKEHKGYKLAPVLVEEGLYWGVMKTWYPEMPLFSPPATAPAEEAAPAEPEKPAPRTPIRHRRRAP